MAGGFKAVYSSGSNSGKSSCSTGASRVAAGKGTVRILLAAIATEPACMSSRALEAAQKHGALLSSSPTKAMHNTRP
jgi:hypothetical protein